MIITFFLISQGNLIKRYSSQQEENVWDQLLYGIRYLDFRVSYHDNTQEKFWLNHDLVQMNPLYKAVQVIEIIAPSNQFLLLRFRLYQILMTKYFSFDNFNTFVKDIRRYLSSTKEVVIMDFHRFPSGFQVIFDTRLIPVII